MSRRAPAPPPKSSSSTVRTVVLVGVVAAIAALILSRGFGGKSTPKTGAGTGGVTTTKAPKPGATTTLDPTAPTTVAPTVPPPTVAPAALKVVVLNGNGIGGTAGKRAAELIKLGYTATVAKDALKKDFADTAVYYTSPDMKDAANALAAKLSLAASPAPADPATYVDAANIAGMNVIVLLGKDKASTPIGNATAPAPVATTTALTAAKAATSTTKKP
jgi:LytR cell envelope-related transcriptional attenuator